MKIQKWVDASKSAMEHCPIRTISGTFAVPCLAIALFQNMPKAVTIPTTARVAPYVPLRNRLFKLNLGTENEARISRLIKYFGGRVAKSNRYAASNEGRIVVSDKDEVPQGVRQLLQADVLKPDSVWSEEEQVDVLCRMYMESLEGSALKLLHRKTVFPVRSKVFKVVGQRMDAPIMYATSAMYNPDTVHDVIAIRFQRRRSQWDDEVLRIQLYCSSQADRWAVHRSSASLFHLCHEDSVDAPGTTKHNVVECGREDRALGLFKAALCKLLRMPYFSKEVCKPGYVVYDGEDQKSGIVVLATKFS